MAMRKAVSSLVLAVMLWWSALDGTQVADISDLARLTRLQWLWLNGTQVADLSPLKDLHGLEEGARENGGLFFANCPNIIDPVLVELANKDSLTRTTGTLVQLQRAEGELALAPPKPIRGGPVFDIPDEGPIRLIELALDEDDPEQAELHQECREKAAALIEAFGGSNQFGHVTAAANRYLSLIRRPADQIGARSVWSSANTIHHHRLSRALRPRRWRPSSVPTAPGWHGRRIP